jgi:hypothetical protein
MLRVLAVHETHTANWTDGDQRRYARDREIRGYVLRDMAAGKEPGTPWRADIAAWDEQPETWHGRPRGIETIPPAGGKHRHLRWPDRWWDHVWPLDDHHPVCASCGDVYPCREIAAEKQAAREMVHVEQLMTIPPGACWHCREPITSRQASITFPGDNLLLPGAPPAAFHRRRTKGCRSAATAYEKRWTEASGVKDPSLFGDSRES